MSFSNFDFQNLEDLDPNSDVFSFLNLPDSTSPLSSPFLPSDEQLLSSPTMPATSSPDTSPLPFELSMMDPMFLAQLPQPHKTELKKEDKRGSRKKRQRKEGEAPDSHDVSAVILSRDQLLSYTSKDLDKFTNQITEHRALTSSEERELRRQRRLIKNRESAQASRQRKKVYIDELEAEIAQLKSENLALLKQMEHMNQENSSLRNEVGELHNWMRKSGFSYTPPETQWHVTGPSKKLNDATTSKVKTAGVCLLIIIFSFGIMFNLENGSKDSLVHRVREMREPVPEVVPHPKGRSILEFPDTRPVDIKKEIKEEIAHPPSPQRMRISEASPRKEVAMEVDKVEPPSQPNTTIPSNVTAFSEESHTRNWFREQLKHRPNTAFFSVSDFQQIVTPEMGEFDGNSQIYISLLVPARSLAAYQRLPDAVHPANKGVMEITCQMMGVNQTTLSLEDISPQALRPSVVV